LQYRPAQITQSSFFLCRGASEEGPLFLPVRAQGRRAQRRSSDAQPAGKRKRDRRSVGPFFLARKSLVHRAIFSPRPDPNRRVTALLHGIPLLLRAAQTQNKKKKQTKKKKNKKNAIRGERPRPANAQWRFSESSVACVSLSGSFPDFSREKSSAFCRQHFRRAAADEYHHTLIGANYMLPQGCWRTTSFLAKLCTTPSFPFRFSLARQKLQRFKNQPYFFFFPCGRSIFLRDVTGE